MAEALVFAKDNSHSDPTQDRFCWKRGMIVVVMPDGHEWGLQETPVGKTAAQRKFVLFKFPDVSVARIEKYIETNWHYDQFTGDRVDDDRRLWKIVWDELPNSAKNLLRDVGIISIGPVPPNNYTWAQLKNFILNIKTQLRETEDL